MVVFVALTAIMMTVAFAEGEAEYVSNFYASPLSLLPPVIAIILALITKEVYSSLFIGILVGGLATIIWTLMGTPYGIQCAIVAVPASVIAILVVSAVTRCNDPKRSLEALYQDN